MEQEKYLANTFNEYKDFIKDKQVSYIIKKTERIVCGVYMLSHFVPVSENLHTELKKTSHALLGHTSQFVSYQTPTLEVINRAHALFQHLSALLTLSYVEGYISQSNIELMKHEINYLHKNIQELASRPATDAGQLQFKAEQFVIAQPKVKKTTNQPARSDHEQVHVSKTSKLRSVQISRTPKPNLVVSVEKSVPKGEVLESRESRIVDVIRDKGSVSIKDISTSIFDVSEKTIQRTLQALIDKGQIKKEGERRWARYELK
jgi:hypothetical protein